MKSLLCLMDSTAMLLFAVIAFFAGSTVLAQAKVCTLSDHIKAANTSTAVGFCPPGTSHDIITIAGDITLDEPLPAIQGTITIEGGGHTISGDKRFRIFDVNGGNLTINNLTLTEGKADIGGAVRLRAGRLAVNNSSFVSNRSETGGGAIYADGGSMRVTASNFAANCVTRATHIVELSRSSAEAARAVDGDGCKRVTYYWPSPEAMVATEEGDGGAISFENGARVSIENVSFSNNKATSGGAIASAGKSGVLTVTGSSFSGNIAEVDGGALYTNGGTVEITQSSFAKKQCRPHWRHVARRRRRCSSYQYDNPRQSGGSWRRRRSRRRRIGIDTLDHDQQHMRHLRATRSQTGAASSSCATA